MAHETTREAHRGNRDRNGIRKSKPTWTGVPVPAQPRCRYGCTKYQPARPPTGDMWARTHRHHRLAHPCRAASESHCRYVPTRGGAPIYAPLLPCGYPNHLARLGRIFVGMDLQPWQAEPGVCGLGQRWDRTSMLTGETGSVRCLSLLLGRHNVMTSTRRRRNILVRLEWKRRGGETRRYLKRV